MSQFSINPVMPFDSLAIFRNLDMRIDFGCIKVSILSTRIITKVYWEWARTENTNFGRIYAWKGLVCINVLGKNCLMLLFDFIRPRFSHFLISSDCLTDHAVHNFVSFFEIRDYFDFGICLRNFSRQWLLVLRNLFPKLNTLQLVEQFFKLLGKHEECSRLIHGILKRVT